MSAPPTRRPATSGPTVTRTAHGGVVVTIPNLPLVSEANAHEHYRERSNRAATQHAVVGSTLRVLGGAPPALPCRVVITRVSARGLDTDNLQGSAKHVRDAVAKWLGVDDRDPRVDWPVVQEKGPAAVRIEVTPVVAWSPNVVSARVALEGSLSVAELTLDPARLEALAAQLQALARGQRAAVTYRPAGALVALRVHLLTPASKETP
jgi:hypothetical protein